MTIWWCPGLKLSQVVGKECLLWEVCSLYKALLPFALVYFIFQGQTWLLLQVSLDFLLLHSYSIWWKGYLFLVLVLEYLIGLHWMAQLQVLWHQWLGHSLRLLYYWTVYLGNELRSFCRFWGCTQVLHFGLLLIMRTALLLLRDSCSQ